MPAGRQLPKKRNSLLSADKTPEHAELASRRRLGSTTLAVKPGQVGTNNATKPENLGVFEYAHLRTPLPEDLSGSEIFPPSPSQAKPEGYFLMRRSSDGYVSATGMFKASFPWAKSAEEVAERQYLKSFQDTSRDEVAGNVWIPEKFALELASEYGILPWVLALLDPADVAAVQEDKAVLAPPKFTFTKEHKLALAPAAATSVKGRGRKAGSPTKAATVKQSSPKKRNTKAVKEANAAAARQASESLQAVLDSGAPSAASVSESEPADDKKENVVVNVKTAVEVKNGVETTRTNVQVTMPPGSPDLPAPQSTEAMIEQAKEMVEAASKIEGATPVVPTAKKGKRKADAIEDAEAEVTKELPVAKRPKIQEQEIRKRQVRTRAIVGFATSLAIGAIVPYVLGG